MMYMNIKTRYILMLLLVVAAFISGCGRQEISRTQIAMDTIIDITIYDCDGDEKSILDRCFEMINDYDKKFSPYKEESDIYRINHSNGEAVRISRESLELISEGKKYSELTNGVFDISAGKLINTWGINGNTDEEHTVPDSNAIVKALKSVDYSRIEIEGENVRLLDKDMQLDLGGIAKGYTADKIASYMKENGVTSAMINLGGNVWAIGKKTDGSLFNIGIPEPFNSANIIYSTKVIDKTVVTSGNYQRYFESDGEIYHHIFDLETGYPARSGLSSVSIVCDSSILGDVLSTTCFILGYEDSIRFMEGLDEEIFAIFITDEKKVLTWEK